MNINLDELENLTDAELDQAIAILREERTRRCGENLPENTDPCTAMWLDSLRNQPKVDDRKPWQKEASSQDKSPGELINREETIRLFRDLWK